MAMMRQSTDLWGYVQRSVAEEADPVVRTLPTPVAPTVKLRHPDQEWHSARNRDRANAQLQRLSDAIASGNTKRADRLRSAWLHTLQADRLSRARAVSCEQGLRLDAIGRGPLCDNSTTHYRDRLPWGVTPLATYGDDRVPDRAAAVIDEWNGAGDVFDAYFLADEPPSNSMRAQSLIGAISPDGTTAEWFVLDRWAS